ncbi:hypothetical protein MSG28_013311 [Choristoneura fumiferana]|uniref:Uncharacterized protein n=1 Tax=Choristoneura fumiferana TaxID=7141 RepID=A0ACC0KTD7_CHOFU|nr:hypothetical protein MSG28_013311 [Choristoneura fumiferana]
MLLLATYCLIVLTVSDASASHDNRNLRNVPVSYEGAQVWRTTITNDAQMSLIRKLHDDRDISLWRLTPDHGDFLIHATRKVDVNRRLSSQPYNMNHTVLVLDVQHRLDSLATPTPTWTGKTLKLGHRLDFTFYPELDVINEYLSAISTQYKSLSEIQTIGYSVENRTIQMAVVSNKNPKNAAILIVAGVHAREWIGVTSALYILDQLLNDFDNHPVHVKNIDWYIIPVVNPDGYEYSHKKDRLWKKNRRKFPNCCGVDLNRNFGKYWSMNDATSKKQCRENYAGTKEFSEPESSAVQSVIETVKISAFVDIHAFGQELNYPWAATAERTPHGKVLHDVAKDMSKAILSKNGSTYKFGSGYRKINPTYGSAVDFMYSEGVHHAYAIETRDTGQYGFLLPPEQIVDTGKELVAAMCCVAKALEPQPQFRSKACHDWF